MTSKSCILVPSLNDGAETMKPQTLAQAANQVITQGADREPNYTKLNDYQKEQLAAQAFTEMQFPEEAYEALVASKEFKNKIAEALRESHIADRNVLLKELGQMLIKAVLQNTQEAVTDALNSAYTKLAAARQFYNDSYEAEVMLKEDIVQRTRDMHLAMR